MGWGGNTIQPAGGAEENLIYFGFGKETAVTSRNINHIVHIIFCLLIHGSPEILGACTVHTEILYNTAITNRVCPVLRSWCYSVVILDLMSATHSHYGRFDLITPGIRSIL